MASASLVSLRAACSTLLGLSSPSSLLCCATPRGGRRSPPPRRQAARLVRLCCARSHAVCVCRRARSLHSPVSGHRHARRLSARFENLRNRRRAGDHCPWRDRAPGEGDPPLPPFVACVASAADRASSGPRCRCVRWCLVRRVVVACCFVRVHRRPIFDSVAGSASRALEAGHDHRPSGARVSRSSVALLRVPPRLPPAAVSRRRSRPLTRGRLDTDDAEEPHAGQTPREGR